MISNANQPQTPQPPSNPLTENPRAYLIPKIWEAVIEAEKLYGKGQGVMKLHYVVSKVAPEAADSLGDKATRDEIIAYITQVVQFACYLPPIQKFFKKITQSSCCFSRA